MYYQLLKNENLMENENEDYTFAIYSGSRF